MHIPLYIKTATKVNNNSVVFFKIDNTKLAGKERKKYNCVISTKIFAARTFSLKTRL